MCNNDSFYRKICLIIGYRRPTFTGDYRKIKTFRSLAGLTRQTAKQYRIVSRLNRIIEPPRYPTTHLHSRSAYEKFSHAETSTINSRRRKNHALLHLLGITALCNFMYYFTRLHIFYYFSNREREYIPLSTITIPAGILDRANENL